MAALGITWVLDGLEVTLAGAVAGALMESPSLRLTEAQIGASASAYLAGAVLGAFFFGWLTDRLGRKRLFSITLGLYLAATLASALAPDFAAFMVFRFLTGAGIGGEYTAINSAIQELVPARYRGRTDLAINGSFWLGAAFGAIGTVILLEPGRLPPDVGWRLAFGIGAALGVGVLMLRRLLPESPRWLLIHGRVAEAEVIMQAIEAHSAQLASAVQPPVVPLRMRIRSNAISFVDLGISLFHRYPRRAVLGLVLMTAQAFCYNAIFFTYALVLTQFFAVPSQDVGFYLLPFAISNFIGPLVLGPLFDTWGRRPMISSSYAISGLLLGVTALLFKSGVMTAATQTAAWMAVFFFASAAASSAYLTVSESFPLEVRALSIALFYALGHCAGRRRGTLDLRCAHRQRRPGSHCMGLWIRRAPHARRGRHSAVAGRGRGAALTRGCGCTAFRRLVVTRLQLSAACAISRGANLLLRAARASRDRNQSQVVLKNYL